MAITDELGYSTTAASNTTMGNSITLDGEVMTPSQVDDAFREQMSQRAKAITRHVTKAAGSYTPAKADHNQFWRCTGAVTLNLTAAATLTDGWALWVRANGGAITIDPNAAETIDGGATIVLADGQTALIICTGSTFYTITGGSSSTLTVNQATMSQPGGRLTLTTAVPVTVSDVTGATNIYYTPYKGNTIALYTGAVWKLYAFTERTLALGTLTSGKPYDVFIYDNAGTLTLEALVWTNDTTRATALVQQDGVYCKTGALDRRYLGTFYTTATTTTEDSKAKRFLWNMYNRVARHMAVYEATDAWAYSITTIRQANNAAANQLDFVRGLDEDMVRATASAIASGTAQVLQKTMIGLDATNAKATDSFTGNCNTVTSGFVQMMAGYAGLPGVGRHFLAWLESSTASGTTTWNGDTGIPGGVQCGIVGDGLF